MTDRDWNDVASSQGMPKRGDNNQELGRGKSFSPRAFGGSMALPTPRPQASGLQNHEETHFYCFNPPSFW